MIRQCSVRVLTTSPAAAFLLHGAPWWAAAILLSLGPFAYICSLILRYKIFNKALDKAPADDAAAIVAAITGKPGKPPGHRTRA